MATGANRVDAHNGALDTPLKLLAPGVFGERLRTAREERGVSRLTLAYAIGCSPSLVQKWEEGLSWPRIPDLLMLARHLGKPVGYFLWGLDGPSFEEMAVAMGVISERDLLAVWERLRRSWNGSSPPPYPDPERDGITEEVRDYRRNLFGEIHLADPPRRGKPSGRAP